MKKLNLANLKRGKPDDRRDAEKSAQKGIRRNPYERLKKGRSVQMAFRCTPEERKMIEAMADHFNMSFNDCILDCLHRRNKEIQGE